MTIRQWQVLSVIIISALVFVWSFFGVDDSIRGVYGGTSGQQVLSGFNPLAVLLYSAQETAPNQYSVEISPTAYFFLPLFWAIVDGIFVLFVPYMQNFFAKTRIWPRARNAILFPIVLVPSLLYAVFSVLNTFEIFRMFADFGIHVNHGFGIDLSGALANSLRVIFWTIFLSAPNIILLVMCIMRGKDSVLMKMHHLRI